MAAPNKKPIFITVTSAKTGSGASIFSANFALSLQRETNARVCILDFDTEAAGDIALLMGVNKAPAATDITPKLSKLDLKGLYNLIGKTKTGLGLIPLYNSTAELKAYNPLELDKLFKQLSMMFNFVIIDTGAHFNQFTIKPYEYSSLIMFIMSQELLTVNLAAKKIQAFQAMQLPGDMIWVICNKFNAKSIINKQLIGQKIKKDVLLTIPEDSVTITNSINNAQPFVTAAPQHALTKSIDQLSRYLIKDTTLRNLRVPEGAGSIGGDIISILNPLLGASGGGGGAQGPTRDVFTRKIDEKADLYIEIKLRVHKKLVELVEMDHITEEGEQDPKKVLELQNKTKDVINQLLDKESSIIKSMEDKRRLAKDIYDEAIGLGCIEELLADPDVSEIMVNHKDQIYAEKSGKLKLTNLKFTTNKHLMGVLERIVAPIGRRIDEKSPMVDARLKDGSRVNAIIPPLSLKGPMLTIRKFAKEKLTYKDLVKFGSMTEEIADFLRACVEAHLNIIVSGGTGSGKTTLLNTIGSFIPETERILTVEDSAELQLPQEHVGTLETRPPNLQGEGEISIRDLVKNTLRMRPDRIVVGECRGAEALDMLQAMNTGHDGSLTTIHSNTPRDCIQRLETLVMFAGFDLPSTAIKQQIAGAVHMVVQLNRFSDGSRKITHITEITGMEGSAVVLQDIFLYKQKGVDAKGKVIGEYISTGLIPKFVTTLKEKGIRLPKGMFTPKA
ncbi:MAG: ATPase, T2SS/T4P/T4SS family [Pseudomonadota bacterium]